jgi:hypothetical protein
LNRFSMSLVCISAPTSAPRIIRFGLLIMSQSSWKQWSWMLRFSLLLPECNNSSGFNPWYCSFCLI